MYGAIVDILYYEYHTDDKPIVLGENNAVARPGNLIITSAARSTKQLYYEEAIKITKA